MCYTDKKGGNGMSIDRLQEKIRKLKNPSVINFDILPEHIPPQLRQEEGSFTRAYQHFCLELLEGLRPIVPAVRFNFGAMSLLGADGQCVLAKLLDEAKSMGYYVILDVPEAVSLQRAKENARVLFDDGCLWNYDGLLVSSYIGADGIKPYVEGLKETGKDLFVILRTANKSAPGLQDLMTGSRLVHHAQADMVNLLGAPLVGKSGFSQVAGVGPASSAGALSALRSKYKSMFLLIDGYDYPNANAKNCSGAFDRFGHGAMACAGNSVVAAWLLDDLDPRDYVMGAQEAAVRMKKNLTRYVTIL